jgi:outer membrane protein
MRTSFRLGIVIFLFALSLNAQSNDLGVWIATSKLGETTEGDSEVSFDNGEGFGVSFNHFWTPNISTEFSATALSHEGEVTINGTPAFDLGSLDLIPITATVQLHFARNARLSPYVGAGVSYVMADDMESENLQAVGIDRIETDSKVGWVAQAGVNIGLSPRFAVAVDGRYIAYSPDSAAAGDPEPTTLELDPLVFSAGVKFRW